MKKIVEQEKNEVVVVISIIIDKDVHHANHFDSSIATVCYMLCFNLYMANERPHTAQHSTARISTYRSSCPCGT